MSARLFASAMTGLAENFSSIQLRVGSMLRSYNQNIRPRAKKFFVRSICFEVMSRPSSDRVFRVEIGISKTR